MCARGMDAGINGDFEYLINESSPASKSAFEPFSLFFARVSLPLSLSLFLYFILILPLYPRSSFFFFSLQYHRANEFLSVDIFDREFSGVHFVSFESATRLMKFYKGEGEFWEGGRGCRARLREPFGNYLDLSSEWIITRTLLLITGVVSFLTNFAARTAYFTPRLPSDGRIRDRNSFNLRHDIN